MFPIKREPTKLDRAIDREFDNLIGWGITTEEYADTLDRIAQLHKLKPEAPKPVSMDTLILASTNILGILLIIRHEHLNVITSKALSFVLRR